MAWKRLPSIGVVQWSASQDSVLLIHGVQDIWRERANDICPTWSPEGNQVCLFSNLFYWSVDLNFHGKQYIFVLFWCRQKTLSLERLKQRLLQEVKVAENEDKNIAEFRQEMELLLQEKMAHVEELRQIHADINAVSWKFNMDTTTYLWIKLCFQTKLYSTYLTRII